LGLREDGVKMARVPDNLLKISCYTCCEEFIVSERAYDNKDICCPFCKSTDLDPVVLMDDKDSLNELGCLGIHYNEE
jgi:hypothetical protein